MIRMHVRRWLRHPLALRRVVLGLCCVGFASWGMTLAAPLLFSRELPVLRMSAGPSGTRRHQVASYLAREASHHGVLLQMETNAGTEECLQALKAGTLDAAIVSSGVVTPEDDDVMVLGALQTEAMHVLLRPGLMTTARSLAEAIRGRRVNIGVKGSTEHLLVRDFLRAARLDLATGSEPGEVIPTELGKAELVARAEAIRQAEGAAREALIEALPDCLVLLDMTPSSAVQALVENASYELMPLPAARAYIADNLQDSESTTTVLLREFMEPTTILARSYVREQGYPETDLETLGVRLLAVARRDVPEQALRPLMETLFEGEFARRVHTKSPRELATSYAIHPAATAYLDRDKPLPVNDVVNGFKQAFSLFGAFSALALSAYGMVYRKKTRKPSDYYAEIRKVELIARGAEVDGQAPVAPDDLRRYLDDRLQTLRRELIEDICEGRIKGDQVLTNILALLNDTRAGLRRESVSTAAEDGHPDVRLRRVA